MEKKLHNIVIEGIILEKKKEFKGHPLNILSCSHPLTYDVDIYNIIKLWNITYFKIYKI